MKHPYPALPVAEQDRPTPPRTPCPEGFHWIGQPFTSCDRCGLPAWEHAGIAGLAGDGPFSPQPWVVQEWKPGEADRIRARWGGQP